MTIFDRINDFITQAGVAFKAVGIVVALFAFFAIIRWGAQATIGRVVIGLVIAGGIIAIVAKPDLLKSDIDNTFAAPAMVQHDISGTSSGGGVLNLPPKAAAAGGDAL